jgi:hypothetical protein
MSDELPAWQPPHVIHWRGTVVAGIPMAKRHGHWLRGYLRALSEGFTGDEALLRGGRYGGMGGGNILGDLVIKKKMEGFLSNPDIQQAIRNVYAEVNFEIDDAVQLHVDHMKGNVTREELNKEGEVVEVKLAPNYAALKDWLKVATPQAPARMHVLTARVGQAREVRTDGSAPPMASRAIGETHEG